MKASEKPIVLILLKRVVIFFLFLAAVSMLYYGIGAASSFLDSTEVMLLNVAEDASLGMLITAVFGLLSSCILALARRHPLKVWGLVGYCFAGTLGVVILLFSQTISLLSLGLH